VDFKLMVGNKAIASVRVGDAVPEEFLASLEESAKCRFELADPDSDDDFEVQIGDHRPQEAVGNHFGHVVSWRGSEYFESARGRVPVVLVSRGRERARLVVNVLPSKLGEARYESMLDGLTSVSMGLAFDLLSKSRMRLAPSGVRSVGARPASVELAVLERLWDSLSFTLQQIAAQPATRPHRVRRQRLVWGSERLPGTGLRDLASRGVDPRRPESPRPFYALREVVEENLDTPEHRAIAAFLWLLVDRALECQRRAGDQQRAIQQERPFRDIDQNDGTNLYKDIDRPKLQRLIDAGTRAGELADRIRSATSLDFLRRQRPAFAYPDGPVFENVVPYRRFRDEMIRYLGTSLAILEEGDDERTKSTSRMYEQWVFIQTLAALRECGLSPMSHEGLLSPAARHRFTIDIEHDTRVSFRCADGRILTARYEPWIHPEPIARQRGDTVYRGRGGEASWCPDILIEVLDTRREAVTVDYALVIDAKYSAHITDIHKDRVRKYNSVRRVGDGTQIVKQVWLAHPRDEGIELWDDAVDWTEHGPNRPLSEVVNGNVGVLPPESVGGGVNETLRELIEGTLSYLGLLGSALPS
jgi:hypothetical protein